MSRSSSSSPTVNYSFDSCLMSEPHNRSKAFAKCQQTRYSTRAGVPHKISKNSTSILIFFLTTQKIATMDAGKISIESKSAASKSVNSPSDTISIGNGTMFETTSTDGSGDLPPMHGKEQLSPTAMLTKREDIFISRIKVLVAIVLLSAVSGVATVTFLLVSEQEKQGFENQVRLCEESLVGLQNRCC